MLERFRYQYSKLRLQTRRLAMGFIVRNEADIIEANIRLHARLGVDAFVVFDHLSTDDTWPIIQRLSREFPILCVRKEDPIYRQCEWSTDIVRLAHKHFDADWVIVNDADEFWIPETGDNLKAFIKNSAYIGRINRYNMIPDTSQLENGEFRYFDKAVANPITYLSLTENLKLPARELLDMVRIKVMVRPQGLIRMKPGNHHARHLGVRRKFDAGSGISIFHYPIRNRLQLENKLRLQKETYAQQEQLRSLREGRGGPHLHRMVKILDGGSESFQSFLDTLIPRPEQLKVLQELGVVQLAQRIPGLLQQAMAECQPATPPTPITSQQSIAQ